MISKFPNNEERLINAEAINITERTKANFSPMAYFATRFILVSSDNMEQLQQEFNLYQVDKDVDGIVKL